MQRPDNQFPIIFVLPLALIITFIVLIYSFTMIGEPIMLVRLHEKFGFDFRDFHHAAKYLLEGHNPWEWERFVTPPWSAVLMIPLAIFPPKQAINIFFVLNVFFVLGGTSLFYKSFELKEKPQNIFFVLITVVLFGHPFYFLLQRGNIDGVVFFLMALGIFMTTRLKNWTNELLAGLFFALAIHIKIYPILILLAIAVSRRWRLLIFTALSLAILALLTFNLWPFFIEKILIRQEVFTIQENGSLVNSLFVMTMLPSYLLFKMIFWDLKSLSIFGYGVYIVLLGLLSFLGFRHKIDLGANSVAVFSVVYIPFMILIPSLAYQYEYVILFTFIPLIFWMKENNLLKPMYTYFLAVGLIFCNIHSTGMFLLSHNPLAYFIPSLGLLIITFTCLHFAFTSVKNKP